MNDSKHGQCVLRADILNAHFKFNYVDGMNKSLTSVTDINCKYAILHHYELNSFTVKFYT